MSDQKHCHACHNVLSVNAAFCTYCGAKVEATAEPAVPAADEMMAAVAEQAAAVEAAPIETEERAINDQGTPSLAVVEQPDEKAAGVQPSTVERAIGNSRFKWPFPFSFKPVYLYSAAAGVLAIVAVAVAILLMSGSSSGTRAVFYFKDGELQVADLAKKKSFEATGRLNFDEAWLYPSYFFLSTYIWTSDDGRFIFYPDRFDDEEFTYYWRDLNADNGTGAAAYKIDSEITEVPEVAANGNKVFYIKGEEARLYVYDRKSETSNKLADDVSDFYVNKAGTYLIYRTNAEDGYNLYEMTIKNLEGNKQKLDSDVTIEDVDPEAKIVHYLKDGNLYRKEHGRDKEKLATDIAEVISIVDRKSIYYLKKEQVNISLTSLVKDDLLDSDNEISEPAYPSLPDEPVMPDIDDYTTSEWVDNFWGFERHPVTNEWGYWSRDVDFDAYDQAFEQYMEDFEKWQQEADRLTDAYYAALEAYEEKQFRDLLREELKKEENNIQLDKYDLYYWNNGTEERVASDITYGGYLVYDLEFSSESPIVIYQKYVTSSGSSLKMSELLEENGQILWAIIDDLQYQASYKREKTEETYVAISGKESVLEIDDARYWTIADDAIYFIDDHDYEKGGTLTRIPVKSGAPGKTEVLGEDVIFYTLGRGGKHYAFKDVKDDTGDLYLNDKLIASDVYTFSLYQLHDSDAILYIKDYSERYLKGTLAMFKDGKEIKIADDVHNFASVDEKTIVYLTDYNPERQEGDLMLYKGKGKPELLDSDVTAIVYFPGR